MTKNKETLLNLLYKVSKYGDPVFQVAANRVLVGKAILRFVENKYPIYLTPTMEIKIRNNAIAFLHSEEKIPIENIANRFCLHVSVVKKILKIDTDKDRAYLKRVKEIEQGKETLKRRGLLCRIDELGLSVRAFNCLYNEKIYYVYELVTKSKKELLNAPNFGAKSLKEIEGILSSAGLYFGMTLPTLEEISAAYKETENGDELRGMD